MSFGRQNIFLTLAAALFCACAAKRPQADAQEPAGEAAHGFVPGVKRRNNCVTQLLNLPPLAARTGLAWKYNNHRNGWVFVRNTANLQVGSKLSISVEAITPGQSSSMPHPDGAPSNFVLKYGNASQVTQEGMRFLAAGEYQVRLELEASATLAGLVGVLDAERWFHRRAAGRRRGRRLP